MSAGTLAIWIAAAFATGATIAAGRGSVEVARRALAMTAVFAWVAAAWLLRALWSADLSLAFVVRHVIRADAPWARLWTAFAEASGSGLLAAACVASAGLYEGRRHSDATGVGSLAVVALVLLAAPLAGAPLAVLPFASADGAMTLPFHGQPWAAVQGIAMLAQLVTASLAFAAAFLSWNTAVRVPGLPQFSLAALIFAGLQSLAWHSAAIASGSSLEVQTLMTRGGTWLVVVLVSALALRVVLHTASPRLAQLHATLAALVAALGTVLGTGGSPTPVPAAVALLTLALVPLAAAVWLGFPGDPRVLHGFVARIGVTLVLACCAVLLWRPLGAEAHTVRFIRSLGMVTVFSWSLLPWRPAVVGAVGLAICAGLWLEPGRGTPFAPFLVGGAAALVGVVLAWRRRLPHRATFVGALAAAAMAASAGSVRLDRVTSLAPGATVQVHRGSLVHQGVSTYEDEQTTILAIALESGPGSRLGRAEQREHSDARGAVLRPVFQAPALFHRWWSTTSVWLDAVDANEQASLRIATVLAPGLWWVALGLLVVALLRQRPSDVG